MAKQIRRGPPVPGDTSSTTDILKMSNPAMSISSVATGYFCARSTRAGLSMAETARERAKKIAGRRHCSYETFLKEAMQEFEVAVREAVEAERARCEAICDEQIKPISPMSEVTGLNHMRNSTAQAIKRGIRGGK